MGVGVAIENHREGRAIGGGLVPSTGPAPGGGGGSDIPKRKRTTGRTGYRNQFNLGVGAQGRFQNAVFGGEGEFRGKTPPRKERGVAAEKLPRRNVQNLKPRTQNLKPVS